MKKEILSVGITDATSAEILEYIFAGITHPTQKLCIVTPNPEIVMYATRHEAYRKILNAAEVSLCDGVGLFMAAKFLGKPLPERITGVDFMESLCKESVRKGVSIGFLGGRNGVAERTAKCLEEKYPGLKVTFVGEEWLRDTEDGGRWKVDDRALKIERRKSIHSQTSTFNNSSSIVHPLPSNIDILFVAYGFPKQEEWIAEHLEKLPVNVMMGVGGAFDYLSGNVSRAPIILRRLGLEWVYRLIRQPWRLSRQLVLPLFFLRVIIEYLNKFKR